MKPKILVIGGGGFIGTELVTQLVKQGYQVRVADKSRRPIVGSDTGIDFIESDVCQKKNALNVLSGIEVCVNLASKAGGIGYFNRYPASILSYNNKIYSSVFEAAVEQNVRRMIFVSSSAVFDNCDHFPSREKDVERLPPPRSGYSFSKLIGEWYCKTFGEEFGLQYTIIRPFNAYGPNELPGERVGDAHVIPDLIRKILSGQYPLELLGNGQQTRCFTHVSDIADGIIRTIEAENAVNEDFNLSSSREVTIIELAHTLWKLCGRGEQLEISFVPGFEHDVQKRIPDVSKVKRLLGWEAKIELEDGLKGVIASLRTRLVVRVPESQVWRR